MTDRTAPANGWPSEDAPLWQGVWRLIERAPSVEGLRAHRIHLLAAHHLPRIGRSVPDALLFEELRAIERTAATHRMLGAAQSACAAPLMILKGPEVAGRYPAPWLRPSSDIDLLAEDPESAQRQLMAAGFEPIGPFPDEYYVGLHHLRPLKDPQGVAPPIEIHRRPNWVTWNRPPAAAGLFAEAVPATSQPGMLSPPPVLHAVLLAAHAWGEFPLRRVSDLIDISALVSPVDRLGAAETAGRLGVRRVWEAMTAAADGLLLGGKPPFALRTWARDLGVPRDRTVFETHLRRWFGPWSARSPGPAAFMSLQAVLEDLTPAPGESAGNKLVRIREALAHPGRSQREHRDMLGAAGIQPRHKRW